LLLLLLLLLLVVPLLLLLRHFPLPAVLCNRLLPVVDPGQESVGPRTASSE